MGKFVIWEGPIFAWLNFSSFPFRIRKKRKKDAELEAMSKLKENS